MIEYKGIKWYFYQGALLPRVPPHKEIVLTREEERELLKKSKALFIRYTSEWDRDESEFWYVIKDNFDGMNELSGNSRSKVRRGEKRNYVKRVDAKYIYQYGYNVYVSAFKYYCTFTKPLEEKEFQEHIKESYEYWAVFDRDSDMLVAYSENFIEDNMCHYSTIKFHPSYLKNYTSYLLTYEMNQYYLNEIGLDYVNDGARSISHDTNVQSYFMDKFKFRKAFVKLHIAYRGDIGLAVKLLYPFRSIIQKIGHSLTDKILVILNQEEIRRSFE